MSSDSRHFFVYGTLMPGFHNYRIVEPFVVASYAACVHGVLLYDGPGFPYAVKTDNSSHIVHGIVLEIKEAHYSQALCALDRLEGIDAANTPNGHYQRVSVAAVVAIDNRQAIGCSMYIAGKEVADQMVRYEPIASGRWRASGGTLRW